MDREIANAVANGKVYSLSFKAGAEGTPAWIFEPMAAGPLAVPPVDLQDNDSGEYKGQMTAPTNALPGVTEQTEMILQQGWVEHGTRESLVLDNLGVSA